MRHTGPNLDALMREFEPQLLRTEGPRWWQSLLASQLLWLWLALSFYWLLRSLIARADAVSQGLPELLNEVGLTLWISGALLTPGLELLLRRSRQNHSGAGRNGISAVLQSFAAMQPWVYSAAVALTLACSVSLLPYAPASILMLASTGEPIEFNLILLPTTLICMLIGGCLAVLMACSLHAALRRWLGPGLAFWIWLLACLLIHWHVISGSNLLSFGDNGGFAWIDHLPLSLGQQFVELIVVLRSMGTTPPYLNETLGAVAALVIGLAVASSVLLLLSSLGLPAAPVKGRLLPHMLAAGGLIPVALLLPDVINWLSSPEPAAPGDWRAIAAWGLGAVWAVYWLSQWPRALDTRAQPSSLLWLAFFWLMPVYWLLLSWPALLAGKTSQQEVLLQALLALFLLAPGCSLIALSSQLTRHWPRLLQATTKLAVLAVLLLPLSGGERSLPVLLLETVPTALASAETRPLAILLLALLGGFHLLAQFLPTWSPRRRHRGSANRGKAVQAA